MSEVKRCYRCRGEGTVFGVLHFDAVCPICDGDGELWYEVDEPQTTHFEIEEEEDTKDDL